MEENDIKEWFYGLLSGVSRRRLSRQLAIKMVRKHPFLQAVLMKETFQPNGIYLKDASSVLVELLRGPVPFHRLAALYGEIPAHAPNADCFVVAIGSKLIKSKRFCTGEGPVLRELLRSQIAHASLKTHKVKAAIRTVATVVRNLRRFRTDGLARAVKGYAQTVWSLSLVKRGKSEDAAKLLKAAIRNFRDCGGNALALKLKVIGLNTWGAQMIAVGRENQGLHAMREALAIVQGLSEKAMATSNELATQLTIVAAAFVSQFDYDQAYLHSLAAWEKLKSNNCPHSLVVTSAAANIHADVLIRKLAIDEAVEIHLLLMQWITPYAKILPDFLLPLYLAHLASILTIFQKASSDRFVKPNYDFESGGDPYVPTKDFRDLEKNATEAAINLINEAKGRGYRIDGFVEAELQLRLAELKRFTAPSASYEHAMSGLRRLRGVNTGAESTFFLVKGLTSARIESYVHSVGRSRKQLLWNDYAAHYTRGSSSQNANADVVPKFPSASEKLIRESWLALCDTNFGGRSEAYAKAEVIEHRCFKELLTLRESPQRDFLAEGIGLLMLGEIRWVLGKAQLARRAARSALRCFSKVHGGHPELEKAVYQAEVLSISIERALFHYATERVAKIREDELRKDRPRSVTVGLALAQQNPDFPEIHLTH